jgi:hypothetical protein
MEDVDGIAEEELGKSVFYQGLPSTSEWLFFTFLPSEKKCLS